MTISIELDEETERRLTAVAEQTGRSTIEHVREAILDYLEEVEDRALALERLESPAKRWTLDELERGLDLDS